jgi:hypothetical protein
MDAAVQRSGLALVPTRDIVAIIVASRRSYVALYDAVSCLTEDHLLDLLALAAVGGGEAQVREFREARNAANARHRGCARDVVLAMPRFGDLLEDGLSVLLLHQERKRPPAAAVRPARTAAPAASEAYS